MYRFILMAHPDFGISRNSNDLAKGRKNRCGLPFSGVVRGFEYRKRKTAKPAEACS